MMNEAIIQGEVIMPTPLAVLIVEDMEGDAQLLVRLLKKAGYDLVYEQVETAEQMLVALEKRTWDIVISDYSLPQFDGHAALEMLKEKQLDIPFIVVTGKLGEESAVAMMKAGAHDYLMKDNLARLAPAVARELEQAQDRRKRKQAEDALRASESFNQAVLKNSPIGISVRSRTGQLLSANEAWKKIWAIPESDLQKDITRDRPELNFDERDDYLKFHKDDVRRVYEQGGHLYLPELKTSHRREGAAEWVSQYFYAIQDADGQVVRVVILTENITERKQVEDQLRQLSRAVEYSPVSIIITDMNGKIEYVNPKFTALAGYTLEEIRGETPRVLKSNKTPPEVYPDLWQTILSGKEWRGEFLNRKKNGEFYWEYSSISSITDAEGNITHFIAVNEDITARKEAEEKIYRLNAGLEQLAMTDYLTSLYNRRYFMQRGVEEFKRTKRNKQSLALLMMDIDEFKSVNDTYGHEAGDMALQQVAAVMKASLRETDILGRMGGEEFAVLLPNTTVEDAAILAERVRNIILNASFETVGEALTISVTICIGVAAYTNGMSSVEDLLRNADEALYEAKHSGRNRVIKYKNLSKGIHGLSSNLDDE
jgi:diguanylate cyclase (GGDEF)-like protein/PAS domain S-box-containing protein